MQSSSKERKGKEGSRRKLQQLQEGNMQGEELFNQEEPGLDDPFRSRVGRHLFWKNVNMSVKPKNNIPGKKILDGVWGEVSLNFPPRWWRPSHLLFKEQTITKLIALRRFPKGKLRRSWVQVEVEK